VSLKRQRWTRQWQRRRAPRYGRWLTRAASRLRLKALTDKGIADAYAANPAAQQRLADGLSSSMHQAITDVGVADAFAANPSAPTNLTTTLGFPRHHPRHQS
jgi:hypothetical protein